MNIELLSYKTRLISIVLILAYAFIHTQLTGLYSELTLQNLADFSVRLPYAQRLLVPALVNWLSHVLPLGLEELFFLMELLFISGFYWALKNLLQQEFPLRQAQCLSWLFILLLPLITVINYRFRMNGLATFYYPSDTASLFFMALGYLFCLRAQWNYLIPLIFLATLNRESSILLVLIIPALHWQNLKIIFKPFCRSLLAYLLARAFTFWFLQGLTGQWVEWSAAGASHSHFIFNILWLLMGQNFLLFVYCVAGLPLFWFAFYDFIPLRYRPLRYVTLAYFLSLLLVGRFMEARIFCEIVVLLYLPVCIALRNWLNTEQPIYSKDINLIYYIDRYAVLGFLLATLVLHQLIYHLILY
ncbi:MAG: hypothetical protein H0U70_07285 [Tatlockia sp.]|nr:hypothetical protein [Tatlockia sp.]